MPHVKVTTRIPVRLKVPDNTQFEVPFRDGYLIGVTIREHEVQKAEGEEHGSGVDDGRGTFLQSTAAVLFPDQSLDEIRQHWGSGGNEYVSAAIEALNACIEAYRYVSHHVFARPMGRPRAVTVDVVDNEGEFIPNVVSVWKMDFLGGITLKASLQTQGLSRVQQIINGDSPLQFEQLLLLDAEFFAELGDARHAVFNIDTALQVFIDRVLADAQDEPYGYYSKWDEGLKSVYGHSLYEAEFIDSLPFQTGTR